MLTIVCDKVTSRHQYIFDWIFKYLGRDYRIANNESDWSTENSPTIFYTTKRVKSSSGIWIKREGLLESYGIKDWPAIVSKKDEIPVLFINESDMGFDVFGAIFYMISRYEEYLPHSVEIHGRFPGRESLAARNNFLQMPVVDIWIRQFKNVLSLRYPDLKFKKHSFSTIFTYDIDVAFKYKGRGWTRQILSAGKDIVTGGIKNLGTRLNVLNGKKDDPWDVYDFIKNELNRQKIPSIFFFLTGDQSKFDHNLSINHPMMRELIKRVSQFSEIGIHPSYYSTHLPEKIKLEKNRLENVLQNEVINTRQHFLKFDIRSTFSQLKSAGLRNDYSMAFADTPGFRSGTTIPFNFYDLKGEKELPIKIYSPCWMDATFVNYPGQQPDKALSEAMNQIDRIKAVDGLFIPIFHNHILGEEKWKNIHNTTIAYLTGE